MLTNSHTSQVLNDKKGISLKSIINSIIQIICLFMFVFLPTSKNEVIHGVEYIIGVWLIISVLVLYLVSSNKLDPKLVALNTILIMYLLLVTGAEMLSNAHARISLARIAPIICLLLLSSVIIKSKVSFNLMTKLLDAFCILMILWNVGILFSNEFVQNFTKNYYSQYYNNALYYSVMMNKPVMSFGIHSYASYFYLFFFYLSFVSAKKTKNTKYYIYCILIFIFTVFLTSNASIIYAIVMAIMLLSLIKKKPFFMFASIIVVLIILIFSISDLVKLYSMIFSSDHNGFLPRYFGANTVFSENINVIKNSFGIGFCIPDNLNLGYSDSGYIGYLTMGHLPFATGIYFAIYAFLKNNLPRNNFLFVCFIVFSFEVALPATFTYRFPFVILFVIEYLNSLENLAST